MRSGRGGTTPPPRRSRTAASLIRHTPSLLRFILATMLRRLDELDRHIAELDTEIEARLRPFEPAIERLTTIPGVGRRTARRSSPRSGLT